METEQQQIPQPFIQNNSEPQSSISSQSQTGFCPSCRTPVGPEFNYCPNCGFVIRQIPITVSVGRQVFIYLISFLFPPFGLMPGIKYLRQNGTNTKQVGIVAIALTIVSLILTYWIVSSMMTYYSNLLNSQLGLTTQLDQNIDMNLLRELMN